jgi:Protein of unknown function (DUF2909)
VFPASSEDRPVRIFIFIAIALIVGSLFSALFFLVKDRGESDRTLRALTIRIGLSIVLFIILGICFHLGYLPLKN